jgi:hypothetical protein
VGNTGWASTSVTVVKTSEAGVGGGEIGMVAQTWKKIGVIQAQNVDQVQKVSLAKSKK